MRTLLLRMGTVTVAVGLVIGLGAGSAQAATAPAKTTAAQVGTTAAQAKITAAPRADLTYNYDYSLGMMWPQTQLQTPESVTREVTTNFTRYFPFNSDCPQLPAVGGVCNLSAFGLNNPIRVVERTPTSFTFISLPGHAEGEGRFVRFTFYKSGFDPFADFRLRAEGWGPWTPGAAASIASGQVNNFWSTFATTVGRAYR